MNDKFSLQGIESERDYIDRSTSLYDDLYGKLNSIDERTGERYKPYDAVKDAQYNLGKMVAKSNEDKFKDLSLDAFTAHPKWQGVEPGTRDKFLRKYYQKIVIPRMLKDGYNESQVEMGTWEYLRYVDQYRKYNPDAPKGVVNRTFDQPQEEPERDDVGDPGLRGVNQLLNLPVDNLRGTALAYRAIGALPKPAQIGLGLVTAPVSLPVTLAAMSPTVRNFIANRYDDLAELTEQGVKKVEFDADPATGKYANGVDEFADLWDAGRLRMLVTESAPSSIALMSATLLNPSIGIPAVAGVYTAQFDQEMKDMNIPSNLSDDQKAGIAVLVGATQAGLERTGAEALFGKSLGVVRNRLFRTLIATAAETTEEGMQGAVSRLGQAGYEEFNNVGAGDVWDRFYTDMLSALPLSMLFGGASSVRKAPAQPKAEGRFKGSPLGQAIKDAGTFKNFADNPLLPPGQSEALVPDEVSESDIAIAEKETQQRLTPPDNAVVVNFQAPEIQPVFDPSTLSIEELYASEPQMPVLPPPPPEATPSPDAIRVERVDPVTNEVVDIGADPITPVDMSALNVVSEGVGENTMKAVLFKTAGVTNVSELQSSQVPDVIDALQKQKPRKPRAKKKAVTPPVVEQTAPLEATTSAQTEPQITEYHAGGNPTLLDWWKKKLGSEVNAVPHIGRIDIPKKGIYIISLSRRRSGVSDDVSPMRIMVSRVGKNGVIGQAQKMLDVGLYSSMSDVTDALRKNVDPSSNIVLSWTGNYKPSTDELRSDYEKMFREELPKETTDAWKKGKEELKPVLDDSDKQYRRKIVENHLIDGSLSPDSKMVDEFPDLREKYGQQTPPASEPVTAPKEAWQMTRKEYVGGILPNSHEITMRDYPYSSKMMDIRLETGVPIPSERIWYHGTQAEFTDFKAKGIVRGTKDIISNLGIHFAEDMQTAAEFANGRYGDKNKTGRVIESMLKITNPKRYPSETDLRDDMAQWAIDTGLIKISDLGSISLLKGRVDYSDGIDIIKKISGANRVKLVNGFLKHLQSNGYDGITYGNNVEGLSSKAAIVFDPKQIIQTTGDKSHYEVVKRARDEGKPIPPEVRADYPDLFPAESSQPAEQGQGEAEAISARDAFVENRLKEMANEITGDGKTRFIDFAKNAEPYELKPDEFTDYRGNPITLPKTDIRLTHSVNQFYIIDGDYVVSGFGYGGLSMYRAIVEAGGIKKWYNNSPVVRAKFPTEASGEAEATNVPPTPASPAEGTDTPVASLETEAKKYASSEEFIASQPVIYHGTAVKFDKFNTDITEGGVVWFTDKKSSIEDGTAGAVGKKFIMERFLRPGLKLAGYDLTDKYSTDELLQMGYDGFKGEKGKGENWYEIYNPNESLLTRQELADIWVKAKYAKTDTPVDTPKEAVAERSGDFVNPVIVKTENITRDKKRFQNRKSDYAEETVQRIVEKYDPTDLQPVLLWIDPKDNKKYLLSGHSRLEALRRLGIKEVPALYFQGNEAEAIVKAKVESNRGATKETLDEDVEAYRIAKNHGMSKQDLKLRFGSNVDQLDALTYLNPRGKWMEAVSGKASNEFNYIVRFSRWMGEARKSWQNLTDYHENQLFDFVYNGEKPQTDMTKDEFIDILERNAVTLNLDPDRALLLTRSQKRASLLRQDTKNAEEQYAIVRAEYLELRELQRKATTSAEKKALQKKIDDKQGEMVAIQQVIKDIMLSQQDLFGSFTTFEEPANERTDAQRTKDNNLQLLHAGLTPDWFVKQFSDLARAADKITGGRGGKLIASKWERITQDGYRKRVESWFARPRKILNRIRTGLTLFVPTVQRIWHYEGMYIADFTYEMNKVTTDLQASDIDWLNANGKRYVESGSIAELPNPRIAKWIRTYRLLMEHASIEIMKEGVMINYKETVRQRISELKREISSYEKRIAAGEKGLGRALAGDRRSLASNERKMVAGEIYTGKTRRMPFTPRKNYVPHYLTDKARRIINLGAYGGGGKEYQAIVEWCEGKIDIEELQRLADGSRRTVFDNVNGNIEESRSVSIPEYIGDIQMTETDIIGIANSYIFNTAKRLAIIRGVRETKGYSKAEIDDYHEAIRAFGRNTQDGILEDGITAGESTAVEAGLAKAVWDHVTGVEQRPEWTKTELGEKVNDAIDIGENIGRTALLSNAAIPNYIGGWFPIFAQAGLRNAALGMIDMAKYKMGNKEAAQYFEDMQRMSVILTNKMNMLGETKGMRGKTGKLSMKFLRWTLFEHANNIVSTGATFACKRWVDNRLDLIRSGHSQSDMYRDELKDQLSWDDAKLNNIIENGIESDPYAMGFAVQTFLSKTNVLRENPLDVPTWMNGFYGRKVMALLTFTRAMGNILMDGLKTWRKYGNAEKLATLLLGAQIGEYGIDLVRGFLQDREDKDENFAMKFAINMLQNSSLGLLGVAASNLYWSYRMFDSVEEKIFRFVAPAAADFWIEFGTRFVNFAKKRNEKAFIRLTKSAPMLRTIAANSYRVKEGSMSTYYDSGKPKKRYTNEAGVVPAEYDTVIPAVVVE